jgi:hypothetical protein
MGLSISLGGLDRDELQTINAVLVANNLPPYEEPKRRPRHRLRGCSEGFPYPWLHYLRRFYAHVVAHPDRTPPPCLDDPTDDPELDRLFARTFDTEGASHLLFHADHTGYYVAVDFPTVIMGPDVPGECLGSSYRSLDELRLVAGPLGITLENGQLTKTEVDRLSHRDAEVGPFYREQEVWFSLFEHARLSIAHRTAIRFW